MQLLAYRKLTEKPYVLSMKEWAAFTKALSLRPLAPRVTQSRLSGINKGYNEMIPGVVHRSPGIYLTAEENPGKPQLGTV